MKKSNLVFVLSGLLFWAACAKNDTAPSASISFQLQTWTSPAISQLITWNAGSVYIGALKIQANQSGNNQIEYAGRYDSSLNLFKASNTATITLPSGYYQQLEFKTGFVRYLANPSFHLEGLYGTEQVILESITPTEISAIRDTLSIDAVPYTAITKLDLTQFTNGISNTEMDAAVRTNGVIMITAFSNPGLFTKMMANMAASASVVLAH